MLNPHKDEAEFLQGAPANVEVAGLVEDMRTEYARAKIVFVATSTAETFCRVAAEARANGIPLLISDAGNLPTFVADGGGIAVPRKARPEEWATALRELLSRDDIAPDTRFCEGGVPVLPRLAMELTTARDIVVVYPCAAPGVRNGVRHLAAVTGAQLLPVAEIGALSGLQPRAVVMCGGVLPEYREVLNRTDVPIALNWRSHHLQMAFHSHEVDQWHEAMRLAVMRPNVSIMASFRDSAEAWARLYPATTRWLPDCYDVGLTPPPWLRPAKRQRFTIPLLGPRAARKNVITTALAARLVGVDIVASDWLKKDAQFLEVCQSVGIEIEWVDLPTEEDVVNLVSSCHAYVTASVGETFGYTACHAMLAGVPVIGNDLVPMTRYRGDMRGPLQANPASITEIADRLAALKGSPDLCESLGRECHVHAREIVQRNNAQARKTLEDFANGASS